MLRLLFISCLPFLVIVHGKTEKDTDAILHYIIREQASMIKHCMSNVCTRNMYNPNRPVRPPSKKMVAFSAYPSHDQKTIAANKKIVFDKIHTNIGNAYDTKTGVFTAPIDGVYVFHWTIMVLRGRFSRIYIQVNDTNKVLLYGDAQNYPNYYTPSQSYVSDLKKGNTVNLINMQAGGHVHDYSTFTGYRL